MGSKRHIISMRNLRISNFLDSLVTYFGDIAFFSQLFLWTIMREKEIQILVNKQLVSYPKEQFSESSFRASPCNPSITLPQWPKLCTYFPTFSPNPFPWQKSRKISKRVNKCKKSAFLFCLHYKGSQTKWKLLHIWTILIGAI